MGSKLTFKVTKKAEKVEKEISTEKIRFNHDDKQVRVKDGNPSSTVDRGSFNSEVSVFDFEDSSEPRSDSENGSLSREKMGDCEQQVCPSR